MSFPELKPVTVSSLAAAAEYERLVFKKEQVRVWAQALAKKLKWSSKNTEDFENTYSVYRELLKVGKTK